jgi:hypothetical protein
MNGTVTIIKSDPGFFVARYICGGEKDGKTWEHYFALEPVIEQPLDA